VGLDLSVDILFRSFAGNAQHVSVLSQVYLEYQVGQAAQPFTGETFGGNILEKGYPGKGFGNISFHHASYVGPRF
jgi:hypothetical protein